MSSRSSRSSGSKKAGFSGQVTVGLQDYRAVEGEYDAVVSVEMIEAVGYEYWPVYFQTIDRVLAPGGKVAIQAITMPHGRMLATRNAYTWVHKYIFPGGFLPSVRAIESVTEQHTTLRVRERRGMGDHYAATLRLWEERFLERAQEVRDLGFDEVFQRMWLFYLCYSRAGFQSGYLDVQQIVLDRREAGSRRERSLKTLTPWIAGTTGVSAFFVIPDPTCCVPAHSKGAAGGAATRRLRGDTQGFNVAKYSTGCGFRPSKTRKSGHFEAPACGLKSALNDILVIHHLGVPSGAAHYM